MANLMNQYSDNRIEVFRQTVERLGMLMGQLQTLEVTLARAKELPDLIALTSHPIQREFLKEEQAIIGHPAGLLIRCLQLDRELRKGFSTAVEPMHAALNAAVSYLNSVVGNAQPDTADTSARRYLEQLDRYRRDPVVATNAPSLVFLRRVLLAIDAGAALMGEIQMQSALVQNTSLEDRDQQNLRMR